MDTELSKKDKKIAREIIARGLNKELKRGLLEFEAILQEWRSTSGDNKEFYHKLYGSVCMILTNKSPGDTITCQVPNTS